MEGIRLGIPLTRWRAVDVSDYASVKTDPRLSDVVAGRSPKPRDPNWTDQLARLVGGDVKAKEVEDTRSNLLFGCFLSHRLLYATILTRAVASKMDAHSLFLVVEDDVMFVDGWTNKLKIAMKHVPPDFDVLRIGYWGTLRAEDRVNEYVYRATPPPSRAATTHISLAQAHANKRRAGPRDRSVVDNAMERFPRDYKYLGTHAIVVQPMTLARLIAFLDKHSSIDDLDLVITNHGEDLKSYVLGERLVVVDQNYEFHANRQGTDGPLVIFSNVWESVKAWCFKAGWAR